MARVERNEELIAAVEGLQRLADVFERRRRQLARDVDLSDAQWRLVEEIASDDFMPSLFARRRRCTKAAVSRTLRQLLDRRLIRVAISSEDGRQRSYALTQRGRALLDRVHAGRARALAEVWGDLPEAEVRRFGRFSARLADRLEAYADRVAGGRADGV